MEGFNGEETVGADGKQLLANLGDWHSLMREIGYKKGGEVRYRMIGVVDDLAVVDLTNDCAFNA